MRLVDPSGEWQSAFLDMAREYGSAGEHRYASAIHDFDAYLRKLEAGRRGEGLPEGWVPGTEFWLEHDGRIIGCVRCRLALTPGLDKEGGHVSYDVRPSMRRRGYGTLLLRLALLEARALGIGRVRVTCDDDNLGSIKVIERNGGVLAGRGVSKETGKTVRQWSVNTGSGDVSRAPWGAARPPRSRSGQLALFPCRLTEDSLWTGYCASRER